MRKALLVTLLSAYAYAGQPLPSTLFRETDGGWANRVNTAGGGVGSSVSVTNFPSDAKPSAIAVRCVNTAGNAFESCSGTGGSGASYVNALIDGGHVTATIINFPATQPVSGTISMQAYAWDGTKIDSLSSTPVGNEFGMITRNIPNGTQPVSGTFWQATQPVSGTLTCNAGTGTLAVSGPLTDTQLRATAVPVSGTVTANAGTGTMNVSCVSGCGSPATPVVYRYTTPLVVAGASKLFLDLFNATGSGKTIKILGIYPTIKTDVAVVGVVSIRYDLYRTSAVGTGGTVNAYKSATIDVAGGSISPVDTSNANLPAGITARHLPAGGATISEWLSRFYCFPEETNAATYWCNGGFNVLDTGGYTNQALTIRENQGLLIKQGTVASLNQIGFSVVFSTE